MPRRPSDQHIDNPADVGRRLRQARVDAGLSQRALAFPGCTPAYISRIEAGQRIPSLQLLREMARRIGVDVEYLARGDAASAAVTDPLAEAELEFRLGNVELARERFDAVAAAEDVDDRQRARALAGNGQIAFEEGDHAGAIAAFERALELWPRLEAEDPAVADSLGRAYAMTGRYELAAGDLRAPVRGCARRERICSRPCASPFCSPTRWWTTGRSAARRSCSSARLAQAGDGGGSAHHREALVDAVTPAHAPARARAGRAVRTAGARHLGADRAHALRRARASRSRPRVPRRGPRGGSARRCSSRRARCSRRATTAYDRGLIRVEVARALVELGRLEEAVPLAEAAAGELTEVSPRDAGRAHDVLATAFRRQGDSRRGDRGVAAGARACCR